ncbi:DUF4143 domain-containing protein [Coxiella burnetii]|uniref:DUF4143 domain-containing protein n=1 Tax=Coxiella burnetii TaxID=777 RepID=UPI002231FCA3|nr:DUF4143 domain-containing protein [Coxiella burnetii]
MCAGCINTVKNYIHFLESVYLIFIIDKYAFSVGDQTVAQKKVYSADPGLMEIMGFRFSNNSGKYLENIVYLELRRRDHNRYSIYYYKTQNNLEEGWIITMDETKSINVGRKVVHCVSVVKWLLQPL